MNDTGFNHKVSVERNVVKVSQKIFQYSRKLRRFATFSQLKEWYTGCFQSKECKVNQL